MKDDGRLQVLVLFPRFYWERKMSPVRRDVIRALLQWSGRMLPGAPRYEARLSGVGWDDYREDKTVDWNAQNLMPDCDAIFTYKPLGTKEVPALREFRNAKPLKVEAWNECWHPNQAMMKSAAAAGIQLAILHHANDAKHWVGCEQHGIKTVHIPHCAAVEVYASTKPWEEREIPVLLTGVLSREYYPLRCQLADLIRCGKIPGEIYPHPGYRLGSVEECDQQQKKYAQALSNAKLVLGCTSKFKYRLARIPEIAMAGAVNVCDLPDQDYNELSSIIVPLAADADDSWLIGKINALVEWIDEGGLQATAQRGQSLMLSRYTQEHYITRLLWAIIERMRELGKS